MALSQYFQEPCNVDGNSSLPQKWKSEMADEASLDNPNGCFDCNICLENAQDPVVTLCGHLYCWPCIYKWLHFQPTSIDSEQNQQNCPVCKADISHTTLVPLYGRGLSTPQEKESDNKGTLQGLSIPQRPPACGVHALIAAAATTTSSSIPHSNQPIYRNPYHMTSISMTPRGTTTTTMSVVHPMMGMFGEMVYARVFGNPELSFYSAYQNNGSGSPRVRRWEMMADKSLNRISIFLFCCFVLCLLLF